VKALLKRYAQRIDAATLRERAMIFAAGALVLVFLVNAALLDPLRSKQKRLGAESVQHQEQLKKVQVELQRMARASGGDSDAANRKRQLALRAELDALNARIAQEQRRFTAPDKMRPVLEGMLERNKRLALLELKTLAVTPLGEARRGAGRPGLFRHGVEMTVSGAYFDLYEYLQTLEGLPTQLYWGRAELVADAYPVLTLKLTVYTVSFDQAWLIV